MCGPHQHAFLAGGFALEQNLLVKVQGADLSRSALGIEEDDEDVGWFGIHIKYVPLSSVF